MPIQRKILFPMLGLVIFLIFQTIIPSQFNGFLSPLNGGFQTLIENEYAAELLDMRKKYASFHYRIPFRTIHKGLANSGFPTQLSFTILSLLFIMANYFLIFKLARQVHKSSISHFYLSVFYFGSFTILFGYLGGMFTYDEPIQYFFILLSTLLILQNRIYLSAFAILLALLSKETSLLFLPFLMYLLPHRKRLLTYTILLIMVIVLYWAYHQFWVPKSIGNELITFTLENRFYGWQSNFKNISTSLTSLFNAYLVLGIPLLLVFKFKRNTGLLTYQRLMYSFLLLSVVSTGIVFVAALASEARLFTLPILLFLPLAPIILEKGFESNLNFYKAALLLLLSICFVLFLFKPTMIGTGYIYKCYAVFYTAIFMAISLNFLILNSNKLTYAESARSIHDK